MGVNPKEFKIISLLSKMEVIDVLTNPNESINLFIDRGVEQSGSSSGS